MAGRCTSSDAYPFPMADYNMDVNCLANAIFEFWKVYNRMSDTGGGGIHPPVVSVSPKKLPRQNKKVTPARI